MSYDKAAIDVLLDLAPPPRRWMTPLEAAEVAKSHGCLIDRPAVGEESRYELVIMIFDLESGTPSSIDTWHPKP